MSPPPTTYKNGVFTAVIGRWYRVPAHTFDCSFVGRALLSIISLHPFFFFFKQNIIETLEHTSETMFQFFSLAHFPSADWIRAAASRGAVWMFWLLSWGAVNFAVSIFLGLSLAIKFFTCLW